MGLVQEAESFIMPCMGLVQSDDALGELVSVPCADRHEAPPLAAAAARAAACGWAKHRQSQEAQASGDGDHWPC
eukprot:COSAG05_NODE_1691_length_4270_cov_18.267801_2_plen_74_part_00